MLFMFDEGVFIVCEVLCGVFMGVGFVLFFKLCKYGSV